MELEIDQLEKPLLPVPADTAPMANKQNHVQSNGSKDKKNCPTLKFKTLLKFTIGTLLLLTAIVFTVLSKLTLISMTSRLSYALAVKETSTAVSLYWQLLFVMMAPQCITFLRTMVRGVCGKTTGTFPWPSLLAGLMGIAGVVLEVGAMTSLVFLVLTPLPPTAAIFAMNGVFMIQAFVDCYYITWFDKKTKIKCTCECKAIGERIGGLVNAILENKFCRFGVSCILQCAPILAVSVCIGLFTREVKLAIALPVCLFVLSAVWSSKWQEIITSVKSPNKSTSNTPQEASQGEASASQGEASASQGEASASQGTSQREALAQNQHADIQGQGKDQDETKTSRYKSNFINAGIRILFYPFVSYIIFRFLLTDGSIDPWCLNERCSLSSSFMWSGKDMGIFSAQLLGSFLGYLTIWISCTMGLHRWGMAIPLFLCTPISVGIYQGVVHYDTMYLFQENSLELSTIIISIALILWFGQILIKGFSIWKDENNVLASDSSMFVSPHYDGILLEQQILLNRKVNIKNPEQKKDKRTVFVCSTMYREDMDEMEQLLTSIYKLACHYEVDKKEKEKKGDNTFDRFESHIFFDGGINGCNFTPFALQLVSLLENSLKVKIEGYERSDTPYGCKLMWTVCSVMPFYIHLKDNAKIKSKKRWSQVMYMNYVLNHLIPNSDYCPQSTFILTTDADIRFEPKSALLLLDTFNSGPKVGAVCARTHPQGSGLLYWYQVFDYAIGHWFQKAAEHILGCVLCCPGCFSAFRCSALQEVLDEYSTEVSSSKPIEFLSKDMGEDRWLCTLLVEKGWRLEYCAVSENHTHCPEDFDTFYKQRRRWIPSTLANLSLLITHAYKITQENDTVSIPFVFYQSILVFSTAISPATVILVIASGFASAYNVSEASILALIIILMLFSVGYGLLCMYGHPQDQLYVAKFASLLLVIFMGVVFAGNLKNVIYDVLSLGNDCKVMETCSISTNGTFIFPLAPSTIYLTLFTFLFIATGLLHFKEFSCLIHGVWYFLALPSGYLILIIYSAANLDDRSWGTRDGSSGGQKSGFETIKTILNKSFNGLKNVFCQCISAAQDVQETKHDQSAKPSIIIDIDDTAFRNQYARLMKDEAVFKIRHKVRNWLRSMKCSEYEEMFEKHGYFKLSFVAEMKAEDFKEIGIPGKGLRLHLEKAAKLLPIHMIPKGIPGDVKAWLKSLEMEEYTELFAVYGYKGKDDLGSLKSLTADDLSIFKKAHRKRLLDGISNLTYTTEAEQKVHEANNKLQEKKSISTPDQDFWEKTLDEGKPLRPIEAIFKSDAELKEGLKSLRNATLAVLLLVNIMWIVLLYTLQFPELAEYNLPTKAFEVIFLAVYALIILVQFCAMIVHRGVTLIHYLARLELP